MRGGLLATVVAALGVACAQSPSQETSLFLEVRNGAGLAVPDELRLDVGAAGSAIFGNRRLPPSGPLVPENAQRLGTVVIFPGDGALELTVDVQGLVATLPYSSGSTSPRLVLHRQVSAVVTLERAGLGDGGGDGGGDAGDSGGSEAVAGEVVDGPDGPDARDGAGLDAPEIVDAVVEAPFEAPLVPQDNGAACALPAHCKSGFCEDGVCCASGCGGTCVSCAVPGLVGVCAVVPAGSDPRGDCPDDGVATCGRDGACDGAGLCRKYPTGTICTPESCTGSTRTSAGTCDGTGTCRPGTMSSCAPYVCGSAGCLTSCGTPADCVSPATCLGMSCGAKPLGAPCGSGPECASGHCIDTVCCDSACAGPCMSCNLAGAAGVCTAAPAGQDPRSDCPDDGAASCARNGNCDGAGACARYADGTVCVPASCAGSSKTPARTCDGAGTCRTVTSTSCGLYKCTGVLCGTSCSGSGDCVSPATCVGSACTPPAGSKTCAFPPHAVCSSDADCPLPTTGWCLGGPKATMACTVNTDCGSATTHPCSLDSQCPDELCVESGVGCESGQNDCHVLACTSKATEPGDDKASFGSPLQQCRSDAQCAALAIGRPYCRHYGSGLTVIDTQCSCMGHNCSVRYQNACTGGTTCYAKNANEETCILSPNYCVTPPPACASGCCGTCSAGGAACATDAECDFACTTDADCKAGVCQYDNSVTCTTTSSGTSSACTVTICKSDTTAALPKLGGVPVFQRCTTSTECTNMFGAPPPADGTVYNCVSSGPGNCLSRSNRCVLGRCLDPDSKACMRGPASACGG